MYKQEYIIKKRVSNFHISYQRWAPAFFKESLIGMRHMHEYYNGR